MDLMEKSERQQVAALRRARSFDYPMPPLTAENMDTDGVMRLYEAVIDLAKRDYVMYKKRLLKGFCDASIVQQERRRRHCENKCYEIVAYFEYIGIKGARKDLLIGGLDREARIWWDDYKEKEQAKAAKAWIALGRCLDDDIY